MKLITSLKEQFDLTYILISHDLSVVHYMADRIVVMQKGQITEDCRKTEGTFRFTHPYTNLLLEKR